MCGAAVALLVATGIWAQTGAQVTGRVLGPDGAPRAGALVLFGAPSEDQPLPTEAAATFTDVTGRFRMPLTAPHSPVRITAAHGADALPTSVVVVPARGDSPELVLQAGLACHLRGRLVDEDGVPMAGTLVVGGIALSSGFSAPQALRTKADGGGRFLLSPLPPGAVCTVGLEGGVALPGEDFWMAQPGQTWNVGDLRPVYLDRTVRGQCLSPDGKPLAEVWIDGEGLVLPGRANTTTDQEGSFTLAGLPPGPAGLYASAGYVPWNGYTWALGGARDVPVMVRPEPWEAVDLVHACDPPLRAEDEREALQVDSMKRALATDSRLAERVAVGLALGGEDDAEEAAACCTLRAAGATVPTLSCSPPEPSLWFWLDDLPPEATAVDVVRQDFTSELLPAVDASGLQPGVVASEGGVAYLVTPVRWESLRWGSGNCVDNPGEAADRPCAGVCAGFRVYVVGPEDALVSVRRVQVPGWALPVLRRQSSWPDGERAGDPLGITLAEDAQCTIEGALVLAVEPHGPAHAAGVQPGDTVKALGDQTVSRGADLLELLEGQTAGERVEMRVERLGRPLTIPVVPAQWEPGFIAEADDALARLSEALGHGPGFLGMQVLEYQTPPCAAPQEAPTGFDLSLTGARLVFRTLVLPEVPIPAEFRR